MNKKLYRDEYHKVIGGVCAGLADYFDMDPTIVRLLFAFAFFVGGVGLGTYIILWIVLPKKGYMYNNFGNTTVDYRVPPQQPDAQPGPSAQQAKPFGDSNYASNPYPGNSYTPPFTPPYKTSDDFTPKPKSHAGIIFGVVLLMVGGMILIYNFDLIPDFDFEKLWSLWPVVLIVIGVSMILSGQANQLWHRNTYQNTEPQNNEPTQNPPAAEDATMVQE
jgi:phage shock protein C